MSAQQIELSDFSQINQALIDIDFAATDTINSGGVLFVEYYTERHKRMTAKQRGALHMWLHQIAETLNNAGMYFARRIKFNGDEVEIEWDIYLVKNHIYKPLLEHITGKQSTEEQDTVEPSVVAATLQRHFAINHGINLPSWPSIR